MLVGMNSVEVDGENKTYFLRLKLEESNLEGLNLRGAFEVGLGMEGGLTKDIIMYIK
jgi:hypothetical protein